jgi:hypothetical protein
VIEADRTVNATCLVGLAGGQVSVGFQLAGPVFHRRADGLGQRRNRPRPAVRGISAVAFGAVGGCPLPYIGVAAF